MRVALFYFAVGTRTGLGHAVRCAALADALTLDGWHCSLAEPDPKTLPSLLSKSFRHNWNGEEAELLVLDAYELDPGILDRLTAKTRRILQIHDGGLTPKVGDLLVNQNADAESKPLRGPAFALVRMPFAERRPRAKSASQRGRDGTILVMPGGTDVHDFSTALYMRLTDRDRRFTVVLTKSALNIDKLARLAERSEGRLTLVRDADAPRIADLMLEHGVLITNGGSTNWERCTLGLPSVTVVMAENQEGNAMALSRLGATILAGNVRDPALLEGVEAAVDSPAEVFSSISQKSFQVTDGLGAYRVAAAIQPVVTRNNERISLRLATPGDCERVYGWQQHRGTRQYSREPRPPLREEHEAWFAEKLRDHRCIFNIILANDAEVGVVRLDYREMMLGKPCYEVSIFVDPKRHKQGIGAAALREARRLTPFATRKAYVDQRNAPSLSLFSSQGYRKQGAFLYDAALC